ncbi:uncharacterized protein UV8b_07841 [Ustilaginoidea virens]|nr:uncharacterized protein UV8b_07841 [Ustilaginoidea virens]QUC23600.1 hypothetical protein UV8b_07841 [Ustilaginoidea virens]
MHLLRPIIALAALLAPLVEALTADEVRNAIQSNQLARFNSLMARVEVHHLPWEAAHVAGATRNVIRVHVTRLDGTQYTRDFLVKAAVRSPNPQGDAQRPRKGKGRSYSS